jgi:hypothetical protein
MKNKMSLKPKATTKLDLKKVIVYTLLGGSLLSGLIYFSLTFLGVINPTKVLAAQVTGYSWDAVITVDHNNVHGQNNLIDFPLVVKIVDPNLKTVANGGMVENNHGFDIVFSDMNGDQLDHQIESYNSNTGEYIAWVKIPILSVSTNTEFKLFYGNANITSDPSTEDVWNSDFEGVWHMSNNPSNSDLDDAAGNYDGVDYGSMNANDLVSGKIGNAIDFDGSNDYYAIKNKNYHSAGSIQKLTVTGWFNTTEYDSYQFGNWSLLDFDRSEYFNVFVQGKGKVGFSTRASIGGIDDFYVGIDNQYNDGNWHYVAAVYDGTNKYLYIDGVLKGTKNNAHTGHSLGKGTVARYGFIGDGSEASSFNANRNHFYYEGKYDEIHFLQTNLSSDWIATEYANQNSPETFSSIAFASSPLPVELTNFDVELKDNTVEITWSTESEINNDYFTIEKSTDAVNYDILDEIPGGGNSHTTLNYNYIDDDVYQGVTYYRLKQTDFDGKFEYFPPKSINSQLDGTSLIIKKVKPNPFTNQFTIEIESENSGIVDFMITNMRGTKVFSSQISINEGQTEYTFSEGDQLTTGTYIVNLIRDGSEPVSMKVIKK